VSARHSAVQVLSSVIGDGNKLSDVLSDKKIVIDDKDKPIVQEICYGTVRWYYLLESILDSLVDKPIKRKDQILKYLILSGLYQLKFMRKPAHAVISETVSICNGLKRTSAKGLVNAILRRYQREADKLENKLTNELEIRTSHPKWLIDRLRQDWPEDYLSILDANNNKPPMYLRVNQQNISRDNYNKLLNEQHITASKTEFSDSGIKLLTPCNVDELPEFNNGFISVQDLAAQLAIPLLRLERGQHVLDACAAPGGKSIHILETEPNIASLTLVEKEKSRAHRIEENLLRMQMNAKLKIADLCQLDDWWDGQLFDRILLDAPCSATGVIRRHPDIKISRTPEHINKNSQLQAELLHAAWQTLKHGGRMLYVTCSILRQENSETIKTFLQSHPDSKLETIQTAWGIDTGYGQQIITGQYNMDGFFYAVLLKGLNNA